MHVSSSADLKYPSLHSGFGLHVEHELGPVHVWQPGKQAKHLVASLGSGYVPSVHTASVAEIKMVAKITIWINLYIFYLLFIIIFYVL